MLLIINLTYDYEISKGFENYTCSFNEVLVISYTFQSVMFGN